MARRQLALLLTVFAAGAIQAKEENSFTIKNDVFLKDGTPFQIISGSVHYFRIHPEYWEDRLTKLQALGLNTITTYVPWNFHERTPGVYDFSSPRRDVVRFIQLCQDLGFAVILRPGPYICSEWDMGGMPWWLASSLVSGGREMAIRTADPLYMQHVERFWGVLLPLLAPLQYHRGGPIIMMQVENELGFFGKVKGVPVVRKYLRVLIALGRRLLGPRLLFFTTDPPYDLQYGTLPGEAVYSVVDFFPGSDLDDVFGRKQAAWNPPGQSPPFCSEFYSGFHPWWGNHMHLTDAHLLASSFKDILKYANGTGSVNFYCIHGGTNGFGLWAGASLFGSTYTAMGTSYDSGWPLSETGDYGQPGTGGPNKYELLREVIAEHTGAALPPVPPRPVLRAYPAVHMTKSALLLDILPSLYPGDGLLSEEPLAAEEYGIRCGLLLYRAELPEGLLEGGAQLALAEYVHDYSTVLLDGRVQGYSNRSDLAGTVSLPPTPAAARLELVVEAMGRNNFFATGFDLKGVVKQGLAVNGYEPRAWRVFPLGFDEEFPESFPWDEAKQLPVQAEADGSCRAQAGGKRLAQGPALYRGTLTLGPEDRQAGGTFHDTYLDVRGWGKGIAWVNGFGLGWYWPTEGPQETLYIPGPALREGDNTIVLLELRAEGPCASVGFSDTLKWRPPIDPPPAPADAWAAHGGRGRAAQQGGVGAEATAAA